MAREDDVVVELKKKKKTKKEKGEYMRKISHLADRSVLNVKISRSEDFAADHERKRAGIGPTTMQDDGQSLEVKEKRKKERKRVIEEPVAPQEGIPSE